MKIFKSKMLQEYTQYLQDKRMQDYVYHCERIAPHVIHGAQVMKEGSQWCCILGDLPTGVVGFGDTPEEACAEFDRTWREGKLFSKKSKKHLTTVVGKLE